jgi:hypothetical protein
MSHNVERCDFIDMLEESARMRRPIAVTLRGDKRFEDTVRDVVTEGGQDYVQFDLHGQIAVREILHCIWTAPRSEGYDAKL